MRSWVVRILIAVLAALLAAIRPATAYSRPAGVTTVAQRASVQRRPCVDCGGASTPMVADHITPLVKEFWATGKIDLVRMRTLGAVQPQCSACSNSQGGQLARFSRAMRKIWGF